VGDFGAPGERGKRDGDADADAAAVVVSASVPAWLWGGHRSPLAFVHALATAAAAVATAAASAAAASSGGPGNGVGSEGAVVRSPPAVVVAGVRLRFQPPLEDSAESVDKDSPDLPLTPIKAAKRSVRFGLLL
jgi:hypothetical protein